jgi:hypothetical protein
MAAYEEWVVIAADEERPLAERQHAFGELVHLFQDMAYSVAYGVLDDFHLAQDGVQESFVTAYRQLHQLREPQAFPGWFKQIIPAHPRGPAGRRRVRRLNGPGPGALPTIG